MSAEQKLHNELVNLALDYDLYNEKCRGMTIDKNFNQVKRLFVTKYNFTPNNYIEAFISDGEDFRAYKARYKIAFINKLSQAGGFKGAKRSGWLDSLKKQYRRTFREVEDSDWTPVINRLELSQNES